MDSQLLLPPPPRQTILSFYHTRRIDTTRPGPVTQPKKVRLARPVIPQRRRRKISGINEQEMIRVFFNTPGQTLNLIINRLAIIILIGFILETAVVVILETINSRFFPIWVTQIYLGKIERLTRKLFCYTPLSNYRLTGII
jgi:hypothetical protein